MVRSLRRIRWLILAALACVTSMTLLVAGQVRSHAQDASVASDDRAEPLDLSGFRLEGAPEFEPVFGGIETFRRLLDRFDRTAATLGDTRQDYYRRLHDVLGALGRLSTTERPVRRVCPDAAARPYYLADRAGRGYRALGVALAADYRAIRELNALGEAQGLTPDYRMRANRARRVHEQAITDYREMRAAMLRQIRPELRAQRCQRDRLIEQGAATEGAQPAASEPNDPADPADEPPIALPPRPPAGLVTFFVDNRGCERAFSLAVDGVAQGEVTAGQELAFQARAGRRSLCLLPAGSSATCGDRGTVRAAYIHNGWSLTTYCPAGR